MKKYLFLTAAVLLFSCSKHNDDNSKGPGYSTERAVGASAHDLLSADPYASLEIQLLYAEGYAPDAAALDQLKSFLQALCNKPGGVEIVTAQIPAASQPVIGIDDINALEKKYRTIFTTDSSLGVFALYAGSDYTDSNVLGIAYKNTSLCLFGKTIADHSGGLGQASRTKLTATIMEHEFGHLLGLVGNGSPMQTPHEDSDHAHHCNDEHCLMYYATETTDVLGFLISGNVPQLDAHCREDLQANGGK